MVPHDSIAYAILTGRCPKTPGARSPDDFLFPGPSFMCIYKTPAFALIETSGAKSGRTTITA